MIPDFWSCFIEFPPFDWSSSFHAFAGNLWRDWAQMRGGGGGGGGGGQLIWTSPAWIYVDSQPLFGLTSFRTLSEKSLIVLRSNLVGKPIIGLPQPDWILVTFHWTLPWTNGRSPNSLVHISRNAWVSYILFRQEDWSKKVSMSMVWWLNESYDQYFWNVISNVAGHTFTENNLVVVGVKWYWNQYNWIL